MKNRISSIRQNERGIVSIIVTVVFIILMSLIVLAMSQNSNREQRQALDRQLSDQAFYNAESGINDWANFLYANGTNPSIPIKKDSCETPVGTFGSSAPQGPVEGVNSYSCVTYDRAPTTIEFKPLTTNDSKFTIIRPASGTIQSLKFTWKVYDQSSSQVLGCNPGANIPESLPGNCNVGGVRFDLFKMQANRNDFIDRNYTAYLLPATSGASNLTYPGVTAINSTNQGEIARGNCTVAAGCTVILNSLNISTADPFYLNIKALYSDNSLTIEGFSGNNAGGTRLNLVDSQIMIDSTGKANDVLRRVQVRLPTQSKYSQVGTGGGDAITTKDSICKLLDVSATHSTATMSSECVY